MEGRKRIIPIKHFQKTIFEGIKELLALILRLYFSLIHISMDVPLPLDVPTQFVLLSDQNRPLINIFIYLYISFQYVEDKEYPCGEIKEEKGIQVRAAKGGFSKRVFWYFIAFGVFLRWALDNTIG